MRASFVVREVGPGWALRAYLAILGPLFYNQCIYLCNCTIVVIFNLCVFMCVVVYSFDYCVYMVCIVCFI